jgi:asparagine synthase (glutamine-hydrolysing)
MCGLVGIVSADPREAVDRARLEAMRDLLRHRGPDDAGSWIDDGVGLGHRRLSIVDVAGGHQPMASEDESAWLVFNGEIYNHPVLRPQLEARGHRYRTRCDAETILHLYEEDGDRCVERLRGMFAFAIWDRRQRRLLLARDRLGIKPLYYAFTERELVFASEIKPIAASGALRPALNEAVLPEFLASGFVAGDETFFRGVRKLLPGRVLTWTPGEAPCERRYWHLPAPTEEAQGGLEEQARELRRLLEQAVRSHLMSDVPLGLFLSGGIDSSGLAALMSRMMEGPLRTFAVGFDEPRANELAYARLAAQAAGAEHREVVVSGSEFFDALPRLIWHEDEPLAFPSSVPLYFVSRLAREHVKVVLTGEGADELFFGYNRYRVTAWNERLGGAWGRLVPAVVRRSVARAVRALPYSARRYAERTFLTVPSDPRRLFYDNFAVFPEALQRRLFRDPGLTGAADPYAEGLRAYAAARGSMLERASAADLQTYLVELLMKQDQMSMAASVESRVPFLDQALVEYAVRLPARFKIRGWRTKAVLRRALRDVVPSAILTRRKMGFPVPIGPWLRGPFWSVVEAFVIGKRALDRGVFSPAAVRRLVEEHRAGTSDHGSRLWLLLNLEIWWRIFLDGEDKAAVMRAA